MSRCKWYGLVAGLALAFGLLDLPAAHAAPAGRNVRDGEPAAIQQLERFVWSHFRPIANLLGVFQKESQQSGQHGGGDLPVPSPQEGVGLDPFGKPGPPGPPAGPP